eukprot:NODE_561_length_6036_cov_1.205491.p1 type:complete len:634 gc:universal NODE_561_length_6036_cov_1.205491:5686-3785(-)
MEMFTKFISGPEPKYKSYATPNHDNDTVASSIEKTRKNRLKSSTATTYKSHTTGKYGLKTFISQYNTYKSTSYSFDPPSDNMHEILEIYFELRAVIGNDNEYGIKVNQRSNTLSNDGLYGVYSSILDFYDGKGYLGERNPVRHIQFQHYFNCLKARLTRDKKENRVSHGSRPIYEKDLLVLLDLQISDTSVSEIFENEFELSWFKAVAMTAFNCVFRIDEVFSLQYRDIRYFVENGREKLSVNLHDRKSVNYRESEFIIGRFGSEKVSDPIPFILKYINLVSSLNRPMFPDSLVFPKLKSSTTKCSASVYTDILRKCLKLVGSDSADMSSHCFRKGGLRHHFIYSNRKWDLDRCLYWAGWSNSDDMKTIGTYLIDELIYSKYNHLKDSDDHFDRPVEEIIYQNQQNVIEIKEMLQTIITHQQIYSNNISHNFISPWSNFPNQYHQIFTHSNSIHSPVVPFSSNSTPNSTSQSHSENQQSTHIRIAPNPGLHLVENTNPNTFQPTLGNFYNRTSNNDPSSPPTRVLTPEDRNVELPTIIYTINEAKIYWNEGDSSRNMRPIKHWSKNARNLTRNISCRCAQLKRINQFIDALHNKRVPRMIIERYLSFGLNYGRKIAYRYKNTMTIEEMIRIIQ